MHEVFHTFRMGLFQVLAKVEVFAEERLGQSWKIDWIYKEVSHDEVLNLLDQVMRDLVLRVLAHGIVKFLILGRFHLEVLSVACILLDFPPFLYLILSLSEGENSTDKPGEYDKDTALNCLINLVLISQKIESPEADYHRGGQETKHETLCQ